MKLVLFRGRKVNERVFGQFNQWLLNHDDVIVTSGYRSPEHNRRIGGAKKSHHLSGRAVDIVGPAATLDHLERTARLFAAVEVLRESDHLHVAF